MTATPRPKREKPPVTLIRVERWIALSTPSLVALSRSEPGKGYELVYGPRSGWQCLCAGFSVRGTCSHVQAAQALDLAGPLTSASGDRELVLEELA